MLFLQQKVPFMKNINLDNCLLFKNISADGQSSLCHCFKFMEKRYKKNEYIIHCGDSIQYILILISGALNVIEDDYWGNRSIIDYILPNQTFGLSYAYSKIQTYPISVMAKTNSKVIFIDIRQIFSPCDKHCIHHQQLIKNTVEIISEKNTFLMERIEHLSKRTTKDKILTFLSYASKKANSNVFDIPFDRQELADYLSVDRSALSNELSKLKKLGMIDFNKNHFTLFFLKNKNS